MRKEHAIQRGALLAIVTLGVACARPADEGGQAPDTATPAAASLTASSQAGDVIGDRREAQRFLDSARVAFVGNNAAVASAGLRGAAEFTRAQAETAVEPAKEALAASSAELDHLATAVAAGTVRSVRVLDTAFARTHLAEARLHCTRAFDAWRAKNAGGTAAEMVMLTDHFERAAKDLGSPLPTAAEQATTKVRLLATRLARGDTVPAAEVEGALSTLDKEVHSLLPEHRVTKP